MGTYKLWELAVNSREEVYSLAQQVVEELEKTSSYYFSHSDWDEPAQALVYAVHYVMWNGKKYPDTSRPPFTHRVNMRVVEAMRVAVPKFDKWASAGPDKYRLTRGIYAVLSGNMLVKRDGQSNSRTHYIREWPKGFVPRYVQPHHGEFFSAKDRRDLDRQEERAIKLAGPIVVTYNLDSIPLPEATPEAILAYTKKVIAAAKALQMENTELRKKIEQLEQSGAWEDVVGQIGKLLEAPKE